MKKQKFRLKELSIKPIRVSLYVPPIVWKGDSAGHIGQNDLFFWVLEGECFLSIESQHYIMRPGQLAYLPKGKMRTYTSVSERFSMYEMAFAARVNGEDLMKLLGFTEQNYVVNVANRNEMSRLFENSDRKELQKSPLFDLAWCANIIQIIEVYAREHQKQYDDRTPFFKPVLDYMTQNINASVTIGTLAGLVYMQPAYFIKKFRGEYGLPPMAYLNRMRIFRAMNLLAGTTLPVEQIACAVGIPDASYFSRVFKNHAGVTPSEYRLEFQSR